MSLRLLAPLRRTMPGALSGGPMWRASAAAGPARAAAAAGARWQQTWAPCGAAGRMGLAACGQPPAPALAAAAGRGLPFSAARLLSSEPAAGHLLRPKEACVLEQFDSDARSVLVPHEHAPLAWQDRSEALQKTLELHGQVAP